MALSRKSINWGWIAIGISLVIAIVLASAAYMVWRSASSTEGSRVYLNDASQRVNSGDEVAVAVRITSREPIDTVTATLQYDPEILAYKTANYDTSRFDSSIPAIASKDTVMVQAAKLGGATIRDDAPVATVVFTAKRSGNVTITLSDGNAAKAGIATNPRYHNVLPAAFWWLVGGAIALAVVGISGAIARVVYPKLILKKGKR
jgi:hypothetical protein